MVWALLADGIMLLHLAFIAFAAFGAFLVHRRPRLAWLHLPAVAWGAWIEFSHGTCPLTPLENRFRQLAGETGYQDDFIGQYLLALIYPDGLTTRVQILLGALLLALNTTLYAALWRARKAHD